MRTDKINGSIERKNYYKKAEEMFNQFLNVFNEKITNFKKKPTKLEITKISKVLKRIFFKKKRILAWRI